MALTLYEHPFALYCQKVLIALYERGIDFERVVVGDDISREDLAEVWPMASIPVLRHDEAEVIVPETTIIIEYLDRIEAGTPPMIPADPDEALEARGWDRFFDQYVATPVQTIVFDALKPEERRDPETVADARRTLDTAYGLLEGHLDGREVAAGSAFSIADCAAAPALFYAWVPQPWSEAAHPNLTRYYRDLAHRPSYARVIDEARPYRHVYPLPWPEDPDRYHAAAAA
jgi:glutathione S-transferase